MKSLQARSIHAENGAIFACLQNLSLMRIDLQGIVICDIAWLGRKVKRRTLPH